jgi:excisionase family DNA binding protein
MAATPCAGLLILAHMSASTQKLAVSTYDAAQMLSVSRRTIQSYITTKVLRARKIGRRTVIPVSELEAFLRTDHEPPARTLEAAVEMRA